MHVAMSLLILGSGETYGCGFFRHQPKEWRLGGALGRCLQAELTKKQKGLAKKAKEWAVWYLSAYTTAKIQKGSVYLLM